MHQNVRRDDGGLRTGQRHSLLNGPQRKAPRETRQDLLQRVHRADGIAQVAFEPARRSGVGERIHFPGYLDTEAYPRALPAFDALIYLVPGSDGTCRAAREALASGVPLISTHRGLLATINEKGRTGVFIEAETPSGIAAAIRSIVEDTPLRERLASGARSRARERFDAQRHARELVAVYRESIA